MGFHNVTFLLSEASFSATFLNNCGRGESLRTTTCLRSLVGCRQGHDPCEILLLKQSLFVSVKSYRGHKTVMELR